MIVDALFALFRGAVDALLSLLPAQAPPDVVSAVEAMSPVFSGLAWANKYVPLVEVAGLLSTVAVVYVLMQLFGFASWLVSKLHVAGGSA